MSTLSRRLLLNVVRLRGIGQLNRMSSSICMSNSKLIYNRFNISVTPIRQFSSNKNNENDDGSEPVDPSNDNPADIYLDQTHDPITQMLSPVTIPDEFPNVPIIAINRYPLFPGFIKKVDVRLYLWLSVKIDFRL